MNATAPSTASALAPALKRGVVLVNVGTPDEPTVPAVRRYLAEFLSDPRVIDLPAPARWLLLRLIILPFRPAKSAHAYRQVWTPKGSPLLLHTRAQAEALQAALPEQEVRFAMRYGKPSLEDALVSLAERGVDHVTLVPLYPQYASATTGTTIEYWHRLLSRQVHPPSSSVLPAFYGSPGFIEGLSERIRETVNAIDADYVLFSYHGLPVAQHAPYCATGCAHREAACAPLEAHNPHCYRGQCHATTRALVTAAGVGAHSTSFQSRLKGQKWIRPFTDEVVAQLARQGVRRLAVACPSFVADCLETLEEIGQRAEATFKEAGGERFALVPAVNASPTFIDALAQDIRRRS